MSRPWRPDPCIALRRSGLPNMGARLRLSRKLTNPDIIPNFLTFDESRVTATTAEILAPFGLACPGSALPERRDRLFRDLAVRQIPADRHDMS